jgi:hypothetical protein
MPLAVEPRLLLYLDNRTSSRCDAWWNPVKTVGCAAGALWLE